MLAVFVASNPLMKMVSFFVANFEPSMLKMCSPSLSKLCLSISSDHVNHARIFSRSSGGLVGFDRSPAM